MKWPPCRWHPPSPCSPRPPPPSARHAPSSRPHRAVASSSHLATRAAAAVERHGCGGEEGQWEEDQVDAAAKEFERQQKEEDQVWSRSYIGIYIKLITMLGKCKQSGKTHDLFQAMVDEGCAPQP
ncbi:hypothetical protein ZWY2020_056253 [Hordeum vulgare]|nr:hypothetical protein ZWY2020_056253 [Hordeum vulgare]